jgi:ribosomal protein L28
MKAMKFTYLFLKLFCGVLLFGIIDAFTNHHVYHFSGALIKLSQHQHPQPRQSVICQKYRICDLTGKKPNRKANKISFSHHKTRIIKGVNLQRKRLWWAERSKFVTMRISCKVS